MAESEMQISVIVPVYNSEKYLEKCVDSILSQTYTDIEVILVNDGSTDRSYSICEMFMKKDKRVITVHKENGGLSDARNAGLKIARGDYVTFIDSDDYIHTDMINEMYNALLKYEADFVSCGFVRIQEDDVYTKSEANDLNVKVYNRDQALIHVHDDVNVIACGKLFKKSLFDNIRFEYGKYHEDEFIIHQLIYLCKTIVVIQCKYYYYVMHPNTIMTKLSYQRVCDATDALFSRIYFVKDHRWNNVFKTVVKSFFEYATDMYDKDSVLELPESQDIQCMILNKANCLIKDKKIRKHMSIEEKIFCISPRTYYGTKKIWQIKNNIKGLFCILIKKMKR